MTTRECFNADLDRINQQLHALGAVITYEDGEQWIDPTKVPAGLLGTYNRLAQYGFANGLL